MSPTLAAAQNCNGERLWPEQKACVRSEWIPAIERPDSELAVRLSVGVDAHFRVLNLERDRETPSCWRSG